MAMQLDIPVVVNPARAGMIPRRQPRRSLGSRKPRASGDDPEEGWLYADANM